MQLGRNLYDFIEHNMTEKWHKSHSATTLAPSSLNCSQFAAFPTWRIFFPPTDLISPLAWSVPHQKIVTWPSKIVFQVISSATVSNWLGIQWYHELPEDPSKPNSLCMRQFSVRKTQNWGFKAKIYLNYSQGQRLETVSRLLVSPSVPLQAVT